MLDGNQDVFLRLGLSGVVGGQRRTDREIAVDARDSQAVALDGAQVLAARDQRHGVPRLSEQAAEVASDPAHTHNPDLHRIVVSFAAP